MPFETGKTDLPDTKGLPKQPDTQPRETKPGKSKTALKAIGYGLGGLMALEGIGATVTELTNDKPASITETLPEDLAHPYNIGLDKVEVISSTFDPTALKQRIGPENTVQMTFEEYEKVEPAMWENESKTLTTILPIIFKDGRIPTLQIEKGNTGSSSSPDLISIKSGLVPGDIICSPGEGKIKIYQGSENLGDFFLYFKGSQGENINLRISSLGLNPLFPFNRKQLAEEHTLTLDIHKGDPIGSLLTADKDNISHCQLLIEGHGPLRKSFELAATSGGKAIVLK